MMAKAKKGSVQDGDQRGNPQGKDPVSNYCQRFGQRQRPPHGHDHWRKGKALCCKDR